MELYYTKNYDGNNTPAYVVIGNPILISASTETIFADDSKRVNSISNNNYGAVTSDAVYNCACTINSTMTTCYNCATTYTDNCINSLDVNAVGGASKYISCISETNGKISATAGSTTSSITEGSSSLVTSGGVHTALTSTSAGSYVTNCVCDGFTKLVTSNGVYDYLHDTYKALRIGTSDDGTVGAIWIAC